MRLIIAGHKGYIGSHLTSSILNSNHEAFGLGRNENLYFVENIATRAQIFQGSFDQISSFLQSRKEVFDCFINLAAETTKNSSFKDIEMLCNSNLIFNSLFAKLAVELNVPRYCFTSTYSVSLDGKSYNPQTFYAATKFASEKLLDYFSNSHGLKVVKLHLYDIYGPHHDKGKIVSLLVKALMNEEPLELSKGTQEFCPLFIVDACNAIYRAINLEFEETFREFSVMGPEVFTIKELAYEVSEAWGRTWGVNQLSFTPRLRFNEIMKALPIYKPLPGWFPEYDLKKGIAMIRESLV
jgi:nucleoside-diphosphate-sugar epimerase